MAIKKLPISMLLLHISDIHFNSEYLSNAMDPDAPIRAELIRDVRKRVQALGPVGAILFTGDIAYRGVADEYLAAKNWLEILAQTCNCPLDRIFVVPGNHDVDQSIIKKNNSTRNAQAAIDRATNGYEIDKEFRTQIRSEDSATALFAPLSAYNAFATNYDCQIGPSQISWKREIQLDVNITLRLYGLTSTFLSGLDPQIDRAPGRLYLSRLQTALIREDNVINLTLCHHPPHWYRDMSEVDSALRQGAQLQFFGHIHDQQVEHGSRHVRLLAGAVTPAYGESSWQPAYNLVSISVAPSTATRQLNVEVRQIMWQQNPNLFNAKRDFNGTDIFRYTIPIDGPPIDETLAVPLSASVESDEKTSATTLHVPINSISDTGNTATDADEWRRVINRFFALPISGKRQLAMQFGLLDEPELKLPEKEREKLMLTRVTDRALQQQFQQAVMLLGSN